MGGRYLLSGSQLGILKAGNKTSREEMLGRIEQQYLGESGEPLSTDTARLYGIFGMNKEVRNWKKKRSRR